MEDNPNIDKYNGFNVLKTETLSLLFKYPLCFIIVINSIWLFCTSVIPADNYKSITKLTDAKSKYDEFRDQPLNNQSCILYQYTKKMLQETFSIYSIMSRLFFFKFSKSAVLLNF